jgi:hypothetical protein
VCLTPVVKRTIAFSLDRRVLGCDRRVRNNSNGRDPGDQRWLVAMINDDLNISELGDYFAIGFVSPKQTGPRALTPVADERQ